MPALLGIKNAFANAGNLVNVGSANALTTTPAGNGTVPQMELNTLGNILAACVNSADGTAPAAPSSGCQSLFAAAPTSADTFTAMINIAHNPARNIGALCALPSSSPPFGPALPCLATALPNDFTMSVVFSDPSIGAGPGPVSIDSQGNVIISGNATVKLTPLGAAFPGSPFAGGGSRYVAVDLQDNIWSLYAEAIPSTPGRLLGVSPTGTALPGTPHTFPGPLDSPTSYSSVSGLSVDGSGALWAGAVINQSNQSVIRLVYSGASFTSTPSSLGVSRPSVSNGIRFDSSQNLWDGGSAVVSQLVAGTDGKAAGFPVTAGGGFGFGLDQAGTLWANTNSNLQSVSPTGTVSNFSPAGFVAGFDLQFDGDNTIWMPYRNGNRVQRFSDAGVAISPTTGYQGITAPQYVAIDGSGDVWLTNNAQTSGSSITEMIGAAGPVTTPTALAVKNGKVAMRP